MAASGSTQQPSLPTTGMRGGLGRTLLTAFLVLAIVPLVTISWYASVRQRRDIQREVTAKLSSVAAMMEAQIRDWTERREASLGFLAALPSTAEGVELLTASAPTGVAERVMPGTDTAATADATTQNRAEHLSLE